MPRIVWLVIGLCVTILVALLVHGEWKWSRVQRASWTNTSSSWSSNMTAPQIAIGARVPTVPLTIGPTRTTVGSELSTEPITVPIYISPTYTFSAGTVAGTNVAYTQGGTMKRIDLLVDTSQTTDLPNHRQLVVLHEGRERLSLSGNGRKLTISDRSMMMCLPEPLTSRAHCASAGWIGEMLQKGMWP